MLYSTPTAGDVVRLDGYYCGAKRGSFAVLEGTLGEAYDVYSACFSASAFRNKRVVSCSGGPVPYISTDDLVATGETHTQSFWDWKDGIAGAHRGEAYTMEVAVWSWQPKSMRSCIDEALKTHRFFAEGNALHTSGAQSAARLLGYPVVERPMPNIKQLIKANVPPSLSAFVLWLCESARIGGSCDPMYISNVVAQESCRGDGQGNFFSSHREASQDDIERIAMRITDGYLTCLRNRVTPVQLREKLSEALQN